jgi:serine/threonine protein kinase
MVIAQLRFQYGKGPAQASDLAGAIVIPEQRRRRTQRLGGLPEDLSKTLELSSPDLPLPAAPAGEAPASPGATGIGPYRVISELARDGVSVVYRAQNAEGGEVALKVLTEGAAGAPDALERFRRSGTVVTHLRHPGIVDVLDVGVHAGQPYLAYTLMEGCRGLDEAFATARVGTRVKWVRDAGRALGHAHSQGVVHRNVKPDNLLVDREGELKVAGFGLVTALSVDLTKSGAFEERPTHMAPEQLDGADYRVGPRTDVWALGVTLYQALTGRLPFRSPRVVELIPQILRGEPTPPTSLLPDLSPNLEAICLRALSTTPAERYPDAAAMVAELDWELESLVDGQLPSGSGSTDVIDLPDVELPADPDLAAGVQVAARQLVNRAGASVLLSQVDPSDQGVLWRAWDRESRQLVLVRVVDGVGSLDDAAARQIAALAAAPMSSGMSLRAFGVTEDGRLYLVTDGVAGKTLAMRRRSPKRTVVVLRDVAAALAGPADIGVVHGAIHPGSVLIDKTFGRGHLIDFGLAPALRALPNGPRLPGRYQPPECFSRTSVGDARSDVYSLGATLYFGLTGQPPGTGGVVPPSTLAKKHVPKTLDTICMKALRDVPDERYPTAGAFAQALGGFLERFASNPAESG